MSDNPEKKPVPAQKVGGVRHKQPKKNPKSSPKSKPAQPTQEIQDVVKQIEQQSNASLKDPVPKQSAKIVKQPPPKQFKNAQHVNAKINQPKPGY